MSESQRTPRRLRVALNNSTATPVSNGNYTQFTWQPQAQEIPLGRCRVYVEQCIVGTVSTTTSATPITVSIVGTAINEVIWGTSLKTRIFTDVFPTGSSMQAYNRAVSLETIGIELPNLFGSSIALQVYDPLGQVGGRANYLDLTLLVEEIL